MKVLFIARATLYTAPGGDTIQICATAQHLREIGITADVVLAHHTPDYQPYDLLHFFNIIRPADILTHAEKSGKPYVISTIFVDYSEWEQKRRGKLLSLITRALPADALEYLKAIGRCLKNKEAINSRTYLWQGHRKSVTRLINQAACLLPNSENEYRRLQQKWGVVQRYKAIPNAIDPARFKPAASAAAQRSGILCVARIEGLKNQLNLIRAFRNKPQQLLLIGKPAPNHQYYYRQCRREATANIQFIDHLPQEALVQYYATAKVHVLPSWFETTGLSSLEAAYGGCNIVITDKGDTREYFGEWAFYCDPDSPASIYDSCMEAYHAPYKPELRDYIKNNFNWGIAARKTAEAYQEILQTQHSFFEYHNL